MHNLTPEFILQKLAQHEEQGQFAAVVLFVDTSGFTPLTTALVQHGAEGAEIIAQVLANLFTPLVEIVYRHAGFVAGFAGDAFKAIFPGMTQATYQRALTAAWQMRQHLAKRPVQETRFGPFPFALKVSVADGAVDWAIWQSATTEAALTKQTEAALTQQTEAALTQQTEAALTQQTEAALTQQAATSFGGAALTAALAADSFAKAGEVVLTPTVAAQMPQAGSLLEPVGSHFRLCAWTPIPEPPNVPPDTALAAPVAELARRFFPAELLARQLQGEFRRVVTVFINVETLPSAPDAMPFATTLFRLLAQYGGFLCRIGQIGDKDQGGTLLLFWGAPTTYEQDVVRAIEFILALQSATPIRLRVGVTTHLVYAGFVGAPQREEYTCYGAHVNLAARHMVMADWGEIWLDDETARLAGAAFVCTPLGSFAFKGFSEARTVYRLLGRREKGGEHFYQGALVGRQTELAQLVVALAPLAEGKFAGVLTLIGEAGIGKSRLVHELQQRGGGSRASEGGGEAHPSLRLPQWFFCQTDEILRQPLNPFRYWLRGYFNQSPSADEATNKAAFTAKLDDLLASLALHALETPEQSKSQNRSTEAHERLKSEITRTRSFLAALVDLHWPDSLYAQVEPQLRFENTLAALKMLILAESLRQPVILHLEDAHWLDADSQTLLTRLTHNVADYPLAIIVTGRPGEERGRQEDRETGRQENEDAVRLSLEGPQVLLRLTTLTPDEIRALAAAQLQGMPAPALVKLIEERAEGNPFFAEQLLHYLREQGWLVQEADGWQLHTAAPTMLLPHGARALLIARLDQLPQPVKEVVQTAAVLGREFDTHVLAQMLAYDQTLAAKLAIADRAAIWSAMTQARYLFRHALLREAAYDMQLRARLRTSHHLAGAALERVYGADLTPYFGELAYHYDQAEAAEEAVRWYGQAGEQASKQYANETAARYFSRALALTPAQDAATRYGLLLGSEAAHNWLGRRQPQQEDLMTLEALTAHLNDDAKRSEVLLRKTAFHLSTGRYQEATVYVEQAVMFAVQAGDALAEARAYHRWGRAFRQAGDYQQARLHLEKSLELARTNQTSLDEAQSLYDIGVIDYYEREFSSLLERVKRASQLFESIDDKRGKIYCLSLYAIGLSDMGYYMEATVQFEAALSLCRQIGLRYAEAHLLAQRGDNELNLGALPSAYQQHTQALTIYQEIDDQEGRATSLDTLGLLLTFLGRLDEAHDHFAEALTIHRTIQDQRGEGYVLTHLGYLLLQQQAWQKAGDVVEQALALRRMRPEEAVLLDTLAAYAAVMQARDQALMALPYVDEMLDWLKQRGIGGIEFPGQVYLACHRVLNDLAQAHPQYQLRALQALADGYAFLQARAAHIQDPALRQSFLQSIPFHHELMVLWQANSVSATGVLSQKG